MNDIVGIDLGTTNSLIGVMEAGFPLLVADENGARLTPSVVYFPEIGEPLVGAPAKRMRSIAPDCTVASIKRLMGTATRLHFGKREFTPEEISALILQKLKRDAERALERSVTRAVITVPAYFNDSQRNATKRAGELAGLTVERIVNEPTAAALAYGLDKMESRSKIAVYDLGGGTFDISILELHNGVFEVLATNGNTQLGGDDIDRALLDYVLGSARSKRAGEGVPHSRNPSSETGANSFRQNAETQIQRLREALVDAKHRLSDEERVTIEIPFFDDAQSFERELTRSVVEAVAQPIVDQTRQHCRRAMADAKLQPRDLDDVILVGGVTRMPLVRRVVAEIFQREPNTSQNPDEAVALGATIQAGILSGAVQNVVLLDVTPLSLGIETFGGLMNVIIPRNSTIPTKHGEMFTTAVSNQRSMKIKVLQGEREMARDNWELGGFEIEFEPAPKGVPRVGVQFEIDANGILHVLARDTRTGAEKIVRMSSAIDVSDEAVEKMLADSLDHAFEDMNERVWTEARMKSEEMLRAVHSAFAVIGEHVSPEEKAAIDGAVETVRRALASHDVQQLKAANACLDAATQALAARVVEQAIHSKS